MLCIPVIAKDTRAALEKISRAQAHAEIIEIRLDLMESFDMHEIINFSEKPVIVTYRSEQEGGAGDARPEAVADYLTDAAREGAGLIDVELRMPLEHRERIIKNRGNSRIIISTHIMDATPSMDDLSELMDKSVLAGGDIIKIVTMANSMDDNLRMLELVSLAVKKGIKIIAFCMGSPGRMSRVFSPLIGGYLTFASLEEGEESAAGQIPVQEMRKLLDYFKV